MYHLEKLDKPTGRFGVSGNDALQEAEVSFMQVTSSQLRQPGHVY